MFNALRTTRVLVLAGDGAAVFDLHRSFLGWSCTDVGWVSDSSDALQIERVRGTVDRAGGCGAVCLVLPPDAVHTRPMGMRSRVFAAVRDEVARSLDTLLPIQSSGAGLGFLDRVNDSQRPDEDDAGAGYLMGVEAADLDGARDLCEKLTGSVATRVIAPHQALLGIGVPDGMFRVWERGGFGESLETVITDGRVTELRGDAHTHEGTGFTLPHEIGSESLASLRRLAIGAVVVDRFASGEARPLAGDWTADQRRVLPGTAAVAAAVLLVVAAWSIRESRYENAAQDILAQQEAIAERVREVEGVESQLRQIGASLRATEVGAAGEDQIHSQWGTLTVLDRVREALPESAFLESATVDAGGVRLRGVAQSAREVLGAMEASEAFMNAREAERAIPLGDGSGRETFAVIASFAVLQEGTR